MNESVEYPWYSSLSGDDLQQGDILERCPVLLPRVGPGGTTQRPEIEWEQRDIVILTQSCDLVKGREKVREVLLCSAYTRSEVSDRHLQTSRGMEEARRGNLPGVHLLIRCDMPGHVRDIRVVNFREAYSLPIAFIRQHAADLGPRLRLLPPYREHLAQSFARYFMRVGLPADIPPFR